MPYIYWHRESERLFIFRGEKMKRKVSVILVGCLLLSMMAVINVYAKPKSDAAIKKYQKYLKKYESQYTQEQFENFESNKENYRFCSSFAIIDMNGDKIPELITEHCNGYMDWELHVFTYKKGKMKELTKKGIRVESLAGGNAYSYFCEQKHLHTYYYYGLMGTEDIAYRLSKSGKLTEYLRYSEYWYDADKKDNGKKKYYENGKTITAKQYKKLSKKCEETPYWKENTATERKKLVK